MKDKFLTMSDYYFLENRMEEYFYMPLDDRIWESYVYDIDGGDNFADFCEEYYLLLDEEGYWENY